jgi:hypothetical protein
VRELLREEGLHEKQNGKKCKWRELASRIMF